MGSDSGSHASRLPRPLIRLLRFRHALLWVWLGFMLARNGPDRGLDWSFFVYGSQLLFGSHPHPYTEPGGLHLFANYPELHMGPLSLVTAAVFRVSFADGQFAAMLTAAALGPLLVLVAERAAARARGVPDAADQPLLALVTLVSGAAFLRAWVSAGWVFIHLDEVLVVAGAAVAVWLIVTRRALAAAAAVGLSIAAKSWAVLLMPLLTCFPRRQALLAGAVAVGVAGASWLPFFAADRETLDALEAGVGISRASGLHVLGLDSAWKSDWMRPTQVGLGLSLGLLAVGRGRWEGALLAAVAARLAIDPATYSYYTAALVFAALVWDLAGRRPLPIWAPLIIAAHVLVPRLGAGPEGEGIARLAVAVAAIVAVVAVPRRPGAVPTGHSAADRSHTLRSFAAR